MANDFRGLQERLRLRVLAEIGAGELTGQELAAQTGFRQAHISNFLNRKRGLSLQAIDAMLKSRKLTVRELMKADNSPRRSRRSLKASSPGMTYIPLAERENCVATDLPYRASTDALAFMYSRLQKRTPRVHTPRPHWQRFIALRVARADAEAMAPRVAEDSLAIVDRHSNAIGKRKAIFLVRHGQSLVLRYVEQVGRNLLLRPESSEYPLLEVETAPGHDPLAAVIGRVCLVMTEI